MRLLRTLTAAAALAMVTAMPAAAQTDVFGHTGSIVMWTVPATGLYFIDAVGAQGGAGMQTNGYVGGRGARIGGSFWLTGGDFLYLAVGGQGSSTATGYNGGGGGGSFVVDMFGEALLVAGGGGGIRAYACTNGQDASITAYAYRGTGSSCAATGILKTDGLGQGGIVSGHSWGGGGAGFYSNGAIDYAGAGQSWANGLAGGDGTYSSHCSSMGGFGGGGSGTGCGGGGGGGGYSGGDGGFIAGGGGSWNTGGDQIAIAGYGYGDGSISITMLDGSHVAPEPVTLILLGTGLAGLAAVRRRRRPGAIVEV
jgi:hypothetical protein